MSDSKFKYIQFIKTEYVPVFYRDWYLDAVTDKNWDVVIVEKNNRISGAYIYSLSSKLGIKYILNPQLCPYTGPIFFQKNNQSDILVDMLSQLPKHVLIIQDYWHQNVLGDVTVTNLKRKKHTYIIDKRVKSEELSKKLSNDYRRKIKKATKKLTYNEIDDFELMINFAIKSFDRKKVNFPYQKSLCMAMDKAVIQYGKRKIVKCTDEDDNIVAMGYFLSDNNWVYNLINAVTTDYRHNGMNLIIWNEIEAALKNGKSFDFEGSMIPGVENFYKRFCGQKTAYCSYGYSKNKIIDLVLMLKQRF
ncbi:MAG: hypothetical protein V3V14_06365 [Saprospiraceae bacterium]